MEPRILYVLSVEAVVIPKLGEDPTRYGLFYAAAGSKDHPAHIVQVVGERDLESLAQKVGNDYFDHILASNTSLIAVEKPKDFPDYGLVRLVNGGFQASPGRLLRFYEIDNSEKINFGNRLYRVLEERMTRELIRIRLEESE